MSGRFKKTAVGGPKAAERQGRSDVPLGRGDQGFDVRAVHSGPKTFTVQYRDADGRSRRASWT
jgi:hypothetical protein